MISRSGPRISATTGVIVTFHWGGHTVPTRSALSRVVRRCRRLPLRSRRRRRGRGGGRRGRGRGLRSGCARRGCDGLEVLPEDERDVGFDHGLVLDEAAGPPEVALHHTCLVE